MLRRIPLIILLAIQAIGGGAITLAHARDVAVAAPGIEASHDGRCAILHDELRCALCHYASARVLTPPSFTIAAPAEAPRFAPVEPLLAVTAFAYRSAPARAPPAALS